MSATPLCPTASPPGRDAYDYAGVQAVAIGGSAGGVEALMQLLPALHARFAPAVLAVLHVRADVRSLLVDIMAPRCALPVVEPEDKTPVIGGTVYIAPPGYHMQVEGDGTIALSVDPPVHFSRPSIDVLFESAAWVYGRKLLALLLSGANRDGAEGMAQVRSAGGRTWAQDPASCSAPTMPTSAIERGAVDEILTVDAMAQRLRRTVGRQLP
jgi:two-component system chemotaxis response regulator CheB